MANQENQQPGLASFLFDAVNPVSQLRYQFIGAFSFPTYYGLRRGKLNVQPMWVLNAFSGGKLGRMARENMMKPGVSPVKKHIMAFLGGYDFSPQVKFSKWIKEMNPDISETQLAETLKLLDENLINTKMLKNPEYISNILQSKGTGNLAKESADKIALRMVAHAQSFKHIMKWVPVAGYAVAAYDAGRIAAKAVSIMYQGAEAFSNFAKAKAENIRAVEFAKPLGGGFISHNGVTERQRAIAEMARTPSMNRRFLGNEAAYYSGYTG